MLTSNPAIQVGHDRIDAAYAREHPHDPSFNFLPRHRRCQRPNGCRRSIVWSIVWSICVLKKSPVAGQTNIDSDPIDHCLLEFKLEVQESRNHPKRTTCHAGADCSEGHQTLESTIASRMPILPCTRSLPLRTSVCSSANEIRSLVILVFLTPCTPPLAGACKSPTIWIARRYCPMESTRRQQ